MQLQQLQAPREPPPQLERQRRGAMTDVGIDDDFIDSVRSKVTPGTSALFVLSSTTVPDRVLHALKEQGVTGELIQTNLSREDEDRLRTAFEEDA